MAQSYEASYGSRVINGQLVPVFEGSSSTMVPPAVGPTYRGVGNRPPATIPAGITSPAGNGTLPGAAAAAAPFSFTASPVPLLILMFVVGVLGLRYIHWRH